MIRTILVPVDGSAHARAAVEFAGDLAQSCNAKVVVLNVMPREGSAHVPDELRDLAKIEHIEVSERDLLRGVAERIVAQAEGQLRARKLTAIETAIESGDPASAIIETARTRHVDLIAMGRRGLGKVKGLLVGSVSSKVSQLADCACVTVK